MKFWHQLSHTLLEKGINRPIETVTEILRLVKERATFASELWDLSEFFFEAPTSYEEKATKNWKEDTSELMEKLIEVLKNTLDFSTENVENTVKAWMTENEIGMGKIMQPLRLSLVGSLKGPHLFDIISIIGKEETIARINKAIETLK